MRTWVVVSTEKKSSFLGSPRDVFRRPSAAPEPIAPKFLHTTFPSKYFVLAAFHPPRLSFGGVMPPTPSFASLQYGLPYSIWQAIKNKNGKTHNITPCSITSNEIWTRIKSDLIHLLRCPTEVTFTSYNDENDENLEMCTNIILMASLDKVDVT